MNIGATIKRLRRERDMTQEQIAELLGVSAQAVSRWETGSALPDITQVPALANVFNVSSDTLLGIDITAKEQRISDIIQDTYFNYDKRGNSPQAAQIYRDALREYPNDHQLMDRLAHSLLMQAMSRYSEGSDEHKALCTEVVEISEKILADCTDDTTRHGVVQLLCFAYKFLGEKEKAIELAMKMPNSVLSRENLLGNIYEGIEKFHHNQDRLLMITDDLVNIMLWLETKLDDGSRAFTLDEKIALLHKCLDLYRVLIEDENYGFSMFRIKNIHKTLMFCYLKKGDTKTAFEHLQLAVKYSILYDTEYREGREYTSLLLRGRKYGSVSHSASENASAELLKALTDKAVDPLRGSDEYAELEVRLREVAGER